jgi:O-antigen/teichoic acid export membrane protein
LLVKPFWIFGIDREVQNQVGSEVYGEYFILFNFSLLLNILLDLGITNYNNRNISRNRQLLPQHLPAIIVLKLFLGLFYLLVTGICAFYLQFSAFRIQLLVLLAVNQFLVSFILYLRSNMAALHLFRIDSIVSVLDRLLMIAFCSVLLWGKWFSGPLQIEWFVYAQTLAYFLTALGAFLFVFSKAPFKKLQIDSGFLLQIVRKSLPYALLVLLMYFYNRMDTLMLDVMLANGEYASGIYAQAYRLLDAVNMVGFLTAGLLYPIFSYLIKQEKSTGELVEMATGLLTTIALPVVLIATYFAEPIMQLLYTDATTESARLFQLLMHAFLPVCITYVFGTLLTANGSLKQLNSVAICGVAINFTLNYLLIPSYEASGSAIATLITQYLTCIAQCALAVYLFGFKIRLRNSGSYALFFLASVVSVHFLRQSNIEWGIQLFIAAALMGFYGFAFRLINIKSMLYIIRYEKDAH